MTTARTTIAAHDVSEQTLSEWKADPEFRTLLAGWRDAARAAIPDMLRSVVARVVRTGDPQAFRAVMEVIGEHKPSVELNGRIGLFERLGSSEKVPS